MPTVRFGECSTALPLRFQTRSIGRLLGCRYPRVHRSARTTSDGIYIAHAATIQQPTGDRHRSFGLPSGTPTDITPAPTKNDPPPYCATKRIDRKLRHTVGRLA